MSAALLVIARELLAATRASRVTVRLEPDFAVAAEAVAPGVRRIADDRSLNPRAGATFAFLVRELRPLVQRDVLDTEDPPPPELVEAYGVRAQMLAPLVADGRLVGVVSVHLAGEPRDWSEADVARLEQAARRALAEIARSG